MNNIYFITGNKGKYIEAKEKIEKIGINLIQKNLGYPEIQADDLEEVAKYGINHIIKNFKETFFLEDAGLFIDTLKGFPGVYSAYVYHTVGCDGILELMKDKNNRKAVFRSVIGYKKKDEEPIFFIGESRGKINIKQKGKNGFGYDPIFIPNDSEYTFAEMKTDEKNIFSHRGKSIEKLIGYLQEK